MGANNGIWNLSIGMTHGPLVKALHQMGDDMASAKVPLERFAGYLAKQSAASFKGQKTNEGKSWPARRGKGSRALLVLSGKMSNTVTSKTKGVIKLTDKKLIFGIRNMPRAMAHNFGRRKVLKGGRIMSNLPPRQFIAYDESTREAFIDIVSDWQKEVISRANKRLAAM